MLTDLEKRSIKYDIGFVIFQMVVYILAGIWAFATFVYQHSPNLHASSTIIPRVTVDYVNDKMHISCFVTIKNSGKIDFRVEKPVTIKVWLIPLKTLTKTSCFDWEKYMAKAPVTLQTQDNIYVYKYAPNDSLKISHDFFIGKSFNDTARYTVLARAEVKFKFLPVIGRNEDDSDYAYDVKIRYKESDPGDPFLNRKNTKGDKKLLKKAGVD